MPFNMATSIIEKHLSRNDGLLDITFYGGETLLAFKTIRKIIEWTKSKHWQRPFKFFGCSNGTLLNDNMKSWFKSNADIICLGLSYDGLPVSQLANRGRNNIDINFFIKTWPKQPIQMTINPSTVSKMAEGVIYLLKKGATVRPNVAYEQSEWPNWAINEYARQLSKLIRFYDAHPSLPLINQFSYDINHLSSKIDNPTPVGRACGAGDGFTLYDVDGKRYPCHLLSPLVLNERQLEKCVTSFSTKTTDFSDTGCLGCPFTTVCSTCLASNWIYRGHYGHRDTTHCRITKIEILATIRKEANRLLKATKISHEDATLVDSIKKLNTFLTTKQNEALCKRHQTY